MGVNLLRERYRVDLAGLQATCEANYLRLMRLLPDMREVQSQRRVALSEGERLLGVLALEVIEACPYTTTLQVRQELGLPWLPAPIGEMARDRRGGQQPGGAIGAGPERLGQRAARRRRARGDRGRRGHGLAGQQVIGHAEAFARAGEHVRPVGMDRHDQMPWPGVKYTLPVDPAAMAAA